MPIFGTTSTRRLNTLHEDLSTILNEAILYYDFSIICGHRPKEKQQEAFNNGKSKLNWPHSKHNTFPSCAVDVAPYPIDWENKEEFVFLQGIIYTIAQQKNIKIIQGFRWGWDYPHVELVL